MSKNNRVRVLVRMRPVLKPRGNINETSDQRCPSTCVKGRDDNTVQLWNWRNEEETVRFQFDGFFDDTSTQEEIFCNSIKPIMAHSLQGQNACVFAYGPTGTGKTYTMLGTDKQPGVTPRCIRDIFTLIEKECSKDWEFKVAFSYLEIYNEKVQDLLDSSKQDLPIREGQKGSIFVTNLTELPIKTFEEFQSQFKAASQKRTTAATKLNAHSSRSHSILLLKVKKTQLVAPFKSLLGKLYLIDLAGSEDNRRTGNKGTRLKESGAINSSLFALGQVVDALNQGKPRIPYRNSKLTRLLQDSLGGNSHSCVIANIAPEREFYFDTINTLNFSSKSRKIINTPFVSSIERIVTPKRQSEELAESERPSKSLRRNTYTLEPCRIHTNDANQAARATEADLTSSVLASTLEKGPSDTYAAGGTFAPLESTFLNTTAADCSTFIVPPRLFSPFRMRQENVEGRLEALERRLALDASRESAVPTSKPVVSTKRKLLSKNVLSEYNYTRPSLPRSQRFLESPDCSNKIARSKPSKSYTDFTKTSRDRPETYKVAINPQIQAAHDTELLSILNSGSVKELKKLNGIGEKKALLIADHLSIHGTFSKLQDLRQVYGFTNKSVSSFVKNNLISKISFTPAREGRRPEVKLECLPLIID